MENFWQDFLITCILLGDVWVGFLLVPYFLTKTACTLILVLAGAILFQFVLQPEGLLTILLLRVMSVGTFAGLIKKIVEQYL